MNTQTDVTILYRKQLMADLALHLYAREMLRLSESFDSNKVLAVAIVELERRLSNHIYALGGLDAAW